MAEQSISEHEAERMSFGEHLEELRRRVIFALIGLAVTCGITLYFGDWLLLILHKPLIDALHAVGLPGRTVGTSVLSGFAVYFKVGLIAGITLGSPWLFYQAWKFIAAGLYERERKAVYIIIPFCTVMAVLGVAFAYFVLAPFSLSFLISFMVQLPTPDELNVGPTVEAVQPYNIPAFEGDPASPVEGDMWINKVSHEVKIYHDKQVFTVPLSRSSLMTPLIETQQFITFVAMMILGVALAFQLPPVMLVLGWTGMIDPALLARFRRHMIVICLLLGALFTPSDPVSMFILAVPLYMLFEFGLALMTMAYRKTTAGDAA